MEISGGLIKKISLKCMLVVYPGIPVNTYGVHHMRSVNQHVQTCTTTTNNNKCAKNAYLPIF